jgi:hypothetical protein
LYLFGLLSCAEFLPEHRSELLEYIDISAARQAVAAGLMGVHLDFDYVNTEPYLALSGTDALHAAHIVDFFLRSSSLTPPSLNRARAYLYRGRGLPGLDQFSETKYDLIWRTFKRAAVFQWANLLQFRDIWNIDTRNASKFVERTLTLLESNRLREYLGACKWAHDRFYQLLDPRALSTAERFIFPDEVVPLAIHLPPLPPSALRRISRQPTRDD